MTAARKARSVSKTSLPKKSKGRDQTRPETGSKRRQSADSKALVVVESPAKAKTINKYLGKGYVVRASLGHVRDLPEHGLGIEIEKNFSPTFL